MTVAVKLLEKRSTSRSCPYRDHPECAINQCVREECPMMSTIDHHPPDIAAKQLRVLGTAIAVCIFALVVLAGYTIKVRVDRDRAAQQAAQNIQLWNPLGEYPTQKVQDRVAGVDGPAVLFSQGYVNVQGSKDNPTEEPIDVRGRLTWEPLEPPTGNIPTPVGDGVRLPGITTRTFPNKFPDEVRSRVEIAHKQGIDQTLWRITGVETPYRNGVDGVPRKYVSDNFTIVYDLPATP